MSESMIKGSICRCCGSTEIQETSYGGIVCCRCQHATFVCDWCGTPYELPIAKAVDSVCFVCRTQQKWDAADDAVRRRVIELLDLDEVEPFWKSFTAADEVMLLLDIEFGMALTLLRRMRYELLNDKKSHEPQT